MTQGDALSILKTGANVFLTGEPGSGKTHTVNAYVSWLRDHGIEPAITASTGIAATHIQGLTIHSWSGIGVLKELTERELDAIASKEHVVRRLQKTSVLIIDEVSMLSGSVLTMLDQVLREVRHTHLPFGGIQVVLVGDFFQLPPISKGEQASFAFEAPVWKALNPIVCYLEEQYRQDDARFFSILSAIREQTTDHTHVSALYERETDGTDIEDEVPRLYTHNLDVDRVNDEKLESLPGKRHQFFMSSAGAPPLIEAVKRGCLSPETLSLKENALVMCTKNNAAAGYVNGTLGKVIGFESVTGFPLIETRDGRTLIIQPIDWAVEEGGKVRAKITQVPLRLAWAITVHKSQGMSLDSAAMDLSKAFEYGQGYVALSRVRRMDGLHLLGWNETAFAIHPTVGARDKEFKTLSEEAVRAFEALEAQGERREMEIRFIRASGGSLEKMEPGAVVAKRSTLDETLALIEAGTVLAEIARMRSITLGTVIDHVEKLAQSGRITHDQVRALVPSSLKHSLPEIETAFKKSKSASLTPIHRKLKGKYSYDELKLGRILALSV